MQKDMMLGFVWLLIGSAIGVFGAEVLPEKNAVAKEQRRLEIPAGKVEFKDVRALTLSNPILGVPILPHDILAATGEENPAKSGLRVVAAKGEYESVSVVIQALKNLENLVLEAGDLKKSEKGTVISSEEIDVRVVKRWYQSGEAWTGIKPSKVRTLTPELLLKNDALVRVDEREEKNHLTLQFPEGRKEVLSSDPTEVKSMVIRKAEEFPFRDSRQLQPIAMKAGENKQYWLTLHVPKNAVAGTYEGRIKMKSGGEELGSIALELRVLPFSLPLPKCWHQPGQDFVSSIFYRARLGSESGGQSYPQGSVSSENKSEDQFRAELKDMLAHNIFNPNCYQKAGGLEAYLKIRNEMGMGGQPLFWLASAARMKGETDVKKLQERVRQDVALAGRHGVKEVYFYGIDEAKDDKLRAQREDWEAVHQAGGKVFATGVKRNFESVGGVLDVQVQYGVPCAESVKKWHGAGHKIYCYANPQTGPENPEVFRRNYGLLLWKAEYDGAMTYAYQHSFGDIYNDFDHAKYRDHVFSYPTADGVIPTLAIEGYREGIDDIRYGTLLKALILENKGKDGTKAERAKEAEKYLETLDLKRDLGAVRQELIDWILKLLDGGGIE
ncbi:MAG: hypothetical protein PHV34_06900 [Verrucomicrobiae bacterium]|nr:hypothetical protein [Verrucomicrobiae bacterium]